MVRLELRDFVFRPRVETVALERVELDGGGRIIAPVTVLDCEPAQRAQGREPTASGVWWQGIKPLLNPLCWKECERSVTIRRGTKAFKNAPAHALGAKTLRAEELLRVVIRSDDGGHATRLKAGRADSGVIARISERGLIGGHE